MAFSITELESQTAETVPAREVMSSYSRKSTYSVSVLDGSFNHNLNGNDVLSGNNLFDGNKTAVLSGNETKTVTSLVGILGLSGGNR